MQFRGLMLLVTWMTNQLLEFCMKKNCKKLIKKNLEYKKYLKEKVVNCTSNGKDTIINLIVGLIKKKQPWMQLHCIKMSQYFPKPFRSFGGNINVKVDLSNYATKTDLKNVTRWDFKFCAENKFS